MMKYVKQFLVIISFCFAGELLHHFIPLPIPAGIYGIILLFIGLEGGIVPIGAVKETGEMLIELMPVMFVPAAVGLMDSWGIVKDSVLAYAAMIFVTTLTVMFVSGNVTQIIIRHKRGKSNE